MTPINIKGLSTLEAELRKVRGKAEKHLRAVIGQMGQDALHGEPIKAGDAYPGHSNLIVCASASGAEDLSRRRVRMLIADDWPEYKRGRRSGLFWGILAGFIAGAMTILAGMVILSILEYGP